MQGIRCGKLLRTSLVLASILLCVASVASAQELNPDTDRTFITALKWKREAGASSPEKLRVANGTLAILYIEGVYAEVTGRFIKNGRKPIALDLNEGFIVRLGNWNRVEDSDEIRIESREVAQEKMAPVSRALPGPVATLTCALEHPSSTYIADTIVCDGLVVSHESKPINLGNFPSLVRQLVAAEKSESTRSPQ